MNYTISISFVLVLLMELGTMATAHKDYTHYSTAFKGDKTFRVYLPDGYETQPQARFPVVYYFHGNKGSHRLPFDEVRELVGKSSVILVCPNGRSEEADDRPYNIGFHSNVK